MRKSSFRARSFTYVALIFIGVVLLFPIAWMLSTVFKSSAELFSSIPSWIPRQPTLDNLKSVIGNPQIRRYAVNSLIVSGSTMVISTVMSIMAGYSLSRFRVPGYRVIPVLLLSVLMFPQVSLLIPLYKLWGAFGLLNSYVSLVGTHLTIALPFGIWMIKGYFDTLPSELEEAAAIDGASRIRTLVSIILPLATPGVVVVALFSFLLSWDEYLFAFTLVTDDSMRLLAVGMVTQYFGQFSYAWGEIMTLSSTMALPILILFVVFQRHVVEGLTAGWGK